MSQYDGYKQKVTDEELMSVIQTGIDNSVGDFLNSTDLSRERIKSTYEYAGVPQLHLIPNGVSSIVSTDTTETVEAYLAIISELMFNNNRIARFRPWTATPMAIRAANDASDLVNYAIFKQNNGWELLNTWVKASLMWKNSIVRWDYIEDYKTNFQEFDTITKESLDNELSESGTEVVGELKYDPVQDVYTDVRIKYTKDCSRCNIENIPQEHFRISRDASTIEDATFIGIQTEMTRSEIRKNWPEVADGIEDWSVFGDGDDGWSYTKYSQDVAARKEVTGQQYWQGSNSQLAVPLEANRPITVTEVWIHIDRDGDGIAELKHIITAGNSILFEEDADMIPLASLCPFEIPYEFYGLSVADMTRSTTLTSTAVLRGFVENIYLTNYAPKLADPNVVDFSALQNMKPKQIVPTNGNPTTAVAPLPPETISPSTIPLLEFMQQYKEQATGMSKAAQGLQDELYVSGNSEVKLGQVMTAAQKRIQHIVRRFAEGGFKRLIEGVYHCIRTNMDTMEYTSDRRGEILRVDLKTLPEQMEIETDVNLGENSNANKREKLLLLATQLIPMLKESGQDILLKPEALPTIAYDLLNTLDLRPEDYLNDHTDEEFLQQVQQQQEQQKAKEEEAMQIAKQKEQAEIDQLYANVAFTQAEADNAIQDNIRQTAIALDKHYQEWADVTIDAAKAEVDPSQIPQKPNIDELMQKANGIVKSISTERKPGGSLDEIVKQLGLDPQQVIQLLQQSLGGQSPQE